jgi:glycosyltransferase involved in cell wall biosynthesis
MIVAHANHLVSAGHNVSIITAKSDTIFILDPRISLEKLPATSKLGTISYALRTKLAADIIIVDIIPMACLLFFCNRNKVVYFAQDYDESYYTSFLQRRLIRCFYFVGLKLFSIPTVAVSHSLANLLRKLFRARVAVAENGADPRVFYPDPDPDLVAAKADRKALLLLSRGDRRKGFDLAREVVKRLSELSCYFFEVWTVGEPCSGLFPGLVHRDIGYVGDEKLRRVMSSADVMLYPTRHEGFGLMPLEAMACGCPVVTTSAVPYAVHGENALVTQIEDCNALTEQLQKLFEDDELRSRLAGSGLQFTKQHTLSDSAQQFEAVLAGMWK